MKARWFLLLGGLFVAQIRSALAHCPLCTMGVAAAAGGAAYLGIDKAIIALFVGAFAVSTGWWVGKKIKKRIIPFQLAAIVVLSFLLTVVPLLPLLERIYPLYISWTGDYGSMLNRTYVLNLSWFTSALGGVIVGIAPWLSKKVSVLRNEKIIPFQGVLLTIGLLLVFGVLLQLVM
ncbi:MAG TPA: hypothetical protein VJC21_01305 [Candidatus Nanoarchaeia archaeon]|nr:hypothetical protein [Candidatus Nanoarchaeia archaeon]